MKTIKIEDALKLKNCIFIDVRTESEYKEDHILDAFNKILKVKEYDNNFITELYSTHLYYTLIRVANIKDKSIKLNIYDKLQSFTEDNFSKDYLSTLYLGFNQSIINHLFFSKKYKSLNILLYLEWKIKNLQIKIKN